MNGLHWQIQWEKIDGRAPVLAILLEIIVREKCVIASLVLMHPYVFPLQKFILYFTVYVCRMQSLTGIMYTKTSKGSTATLMNRIYNMTSS